VLGRHHPGRVDGGRCREQQVLGEGTGTDDGADHAVIVPAGSSSDP
jgi:hypothetical protein